jgi:acetoin utilization protein AcuC
MPDLPESDLPKSDGPLLVFGPRSVTYDFGPRHPLSPRRFGPGIELLRAVGAEPGLAPEPAPDEELTWLHSPDYVAAVRRFSADPWADPEAGIGPGDDPAFAGMHEAAAAVAGGSIGAVEAILRGDVDHAYHPGGGLHHAMRGRASGFCVYNDVALAIARARREGLRVLYVDLDVHHGDGVQALHYSDPGVMTISFHESGRSLFPGTGYVAETGQGIAAGTSVNVPLEPHTGPDAWIAAVRAVVPPLAAAFGPDIVVSQHGADGHVWDPLAHLSLTTTAMGEAARLVDKIAHTYAAGRWLATGGGGYAVYRVVPRVWALTWLAGAHREPPARLPEAWRNRWHGDAARWDDAPLPETFDDAPDLLSDRSIAASAAERARRTVQIVRTVMVPALLSVAEETGWWRFDVASPPTSSGAAPAAEAPPAGSRKAGLRPESGVASAAKPTPGSAPAGARASRTEPSVAAPLTAEMLERLSLAPRVVDPFAPAVAAALVRAAVAEGGVAAGAIAGEWLVGVALAVPAPLDGVDRLVALGVAPEWRRAGVARALLRSLADVTANRGRTLAALHTLAERDPLDPLPRAVRRGVAESLARQAGMTILPAPAHVVAADPEAFVAVRLPSGASPDGRSPIEEWFASG